jgi:hypothetical protein
MTRRATGSVLELHAVPAEVIGCFGRPAVLDQISEAAQLPVRVAPDELLLLSVGATSARPRRMQEIEAALGAQDGGGLVLDLSSGFAIWTLRGDDRFEAFSRLSALELPEGASSVRPPAVLQGLVAHVPAKVVVSSDSLLLIVSSVLSHHIRKRVLVACADLAPSERDPLRLDGLPVEERGTA